MLLHHESKITLDSSNPPLCMLHSMQQLPLLEFRTFDMLLHAPDCSTAEARATSSFLLKAINLQVI